MRTANAEQYAIDQLTSRYVGVACHNLYFHGWRFMWSQSRTRAGRCIVTRHDSTGGWVKRIILSCPITKVNSRSTIEAVVLHEIAHAIAYEYGRGLDHSGWWHDITYSIGGQAAAMTKVKVRLPRGKYRYRCPDCGSRSERSRRVRAGYEIGCVWCRKNKKVWVRMEEVRS